VYWVPQDAVRRGVRRSLLEGRKDLPTREDVVGVRAGHPIFVSPQYTVDPLWTFYGQSPRFRRFTAETKRNYATDTALWLSALCSRGKTCLEASPKDLNDFEHWRLGGLPGHRLQGEAGLRRSQAGG
jgi:hypothetical protein